MLRTLFFFAALTAAHASNTGKSWGVERSVYTDPVTGVQVTEITKAGSASDNLYYHYSNFTADDRYLIFVSNRTGRNELYRYTVDSGEIVQLTDDAAVSPSTACPDKRDARVVWVMRGAQVMRLDVIDFSLKPAATLPPGAYGQLTQSGDGRYLATSRKLDEHNWEIGVVEVSNGEYKRVITQGFQIGHVQHSPTDSVIFYVWETGGYAPQRTWVVNRDGSGNRPFYAAKKDEKSWITPLKEWVTHESYVASSGDMTMIVDKLGAILVRPDGSMKVVRDGAYWHCTSTDSGAYLGLDDQQGRIWISNMKTGSVKLLATGMRAAVPVHAHLSFDHAGRRMQFHTGRMHETLALIDLTGLTP